MKFSFLFNLALLGALGVSLSTLPTGLTSAQNNPPARTFQPGPWQPVGRINTGKPVQLRIINKTDLILDYDLSNNIKPSPQQIPVGGTTMLKSFRIPAYVFVNRSISTSSRFASSLIYAVEVQDNNTVTLTVTKAGADTPGFTTFNIDREGAIYIY